MTDPSLPLARRGRREASTKTGLDTKPKMICTIFSIGCYFSPLGSKPRECKKRSPDSAPSCTFGIFIRVQNCLDLYHRKDRINPSTMNFRNI